MKKRRFYVREYSPIWFVIWFGGCILELIAVTLAVTVVIGSFWALSWMLYLI